MLKPLKTLIIEDSEYDLILLESFLSEYPERFRIDYKAISFEAGIGALSKKEKFDLTIIDYALGDMVWYDIIETVGIKNMGIIVLHTATPGGAYDRTENARNFLFLKKPLNTIDFAKFLIKIDTRIEELDSEEHQAKFRNHILINKTEHIYLKDADIIYVEGGGNYSRYYTRKQKSVYTTSVALGETLKTLNPKVFIRCHNSYIINIDYIHRIIKDDQSGGDVHLTRENGNSELKTEEKHFSIPYTKTYRHFLVEKGFLPK